MAEYKISGTQTITFNVDIEANSEDEALDLFDPINDDTWYNVQMNLEYKSEGVLQPTLPTVSEV